MIRYNKFQAGAEHQRNTEKEGRDGFCGFPASFSRLTGGGQCCIRMNGVLAVDDDDDDR